MLRVLVVDDSLTVRELLAEILNSDPEIEVIDQAANGFDAVRLVHHHQPDVVTMDIHMPGMSGLEATRKIMAERPTPIVIVTSTTKIHDVQWAMTALQAGALTLLTKPCGPPSPAFPSAAKELIETVKAMAAVKVVRRRDRLAASPAESSNLPTPKNRNCGVVAIAASTGGPPVIEQILSSLPVDFPAPIMIVQHIAEGFTHGFVSWLDAAVALRVKQAEAKESPVAGTVYVAPERRHLGIDESGKILLSQGRPVHGFCPSATFLFGSLGRQFGRDSIGVILTGMGDDGVAGLVTMHQCGGYVIAQDKESCVVYGMPGEAEQAGVVDATLSADQIGPSILRMTTARTHRLDRS